MTDVGLRRTHRHSRGGVETAIDTRAHGGVCFTGKIKASPFNWHLSGHLLWKKAISLYAHRREGLVHTHTFPCLQGFVCEAQGNRCAVRERETVRMFLCCVSLFPDTYMLASESTTALVGGLHTVLCCECSLSKLWWEVEGHECLQSLTRIARP
jgi:hypothetical protein